MGLDHSATYKDKRLKNLPHRKRLEAILSTLDREGPFEGKSFADVGCSNGYITGIMRDRFRPTRVCGYDHESANLEEARTRYPDIEFRTIDLNAVSQPEDRFDVVTNFEVLEHVGDLQCALENLLNMTRPGTGLLFLTVPIEIGWRGVVKFVVKTFFYRYRLDELPPQKNLFLKYFIALLSGRRMSRFRSKRKGWGTHFGFDYRDVDEFFTSRGIECRTANRFMSRFYRVKPMR